MTEPVSVVIPTWNAGEGFRETLTAVRRQEGVELQDLVVLDSESTDGTVRLAEQQGARVRMVRRTTFNHGLTRNLGVALTRARWVAFLTQDALPVNRRWLFHLVDAARAHQAMGAYGRVLPRREATPLVARTVRSDLVFQEQRLVKHASAEELGAMDPFLRRVFVHFNNVSSLVDREKFATLPFPGIPFGEDLAWADRVLEAGHVLVFEPRSLVWHSHSSGWRRDYHRHCQDAVLMRTLFGFRNRDGWRDCVPAWWQEIQRDRAWLRQAGLPWLERLGWLAKATVLRACQIAGQLAGSRGEGLPPPRFPPSLPPGELP